MLSFVRIDGDSLAPDLRHGDYILVAAAGWARRRLRAGDVVVFTHPIYGRLVKRLERVSEDGQRLFVVGNSPDSLDSRRFGAIPRASVSARAVLKIRRKS